MNLIFDLDADKCIILHRHSPHCKPKPCKAYRELPVSQFSQGKPGFHYRDFPVKPCTSLYRITVYAYCKKFQTHPGNGKNSKQISQRAPLSYKSHLWLTGWQLWTCSSGKRTRWLILRDTHNKNFLVTEKLTFCISRQSLFCTEPVISVFRKFTYQFYPSIV